MINAVLVFNNAGQPRLTKFYTQLARLPLFLSKPLLTVFPTGNLRPTTPHLRNLHPRLPPPHRLLQLPPPPPSPLPRLHFLNLKHYSHHLIRTQRRPIPRNLSTLRNPLLHHNLHQYRIPSRSDRSNPSLRRST
jgi:hypothetical protein